MSNDHTSKLLAHGLLTSDLLEICSRLGLKSFRAGQLARWLYVQYADDWSRMKNISPADRSKLEQVLELESVSIVERNGVSSGTEKLLVELRDGEQVEQVLIPSRERRTVCVSSQAGCAFGCSFCASGQAGFRRNLEPAEIVGQVIVAAREYAVRPTNVVFMGIGEPFDNYDNVLKAVRIINAEDGLGIGARRITISTCGVIPGIERLSGEGLQVELSVSLHSASAGVRSKLMPVNRKYALPDLIEACRNYTERTGRIITFEYTMIKGVNDRHVDMIQLCRLLKGLHCRVNFIPLSPVAEYDGSASDRTVIDTFIDELIGNGINATARASKGGGINAACGQLRYG